MKYYLPAFFFLFSFLVRGQDIILKTDKKQYHIGDTVRLHYDFDSLEVIYSNFGGCGGGPYFEVRCQTYAGFNIFPVHCDWLLEELSYAAQGTFEIPIRNPGIYSISLYVKSRYQEVPHPNLFKKMVRSEEFEVVEK